MRNIILLGFLLLISCRSDGQTDSNLNIENKLIEHFKSQSLNDSIINRNSLYKTNYTGENFNVSISNNLINFETKQIVIKTPYFSEKYTESEKDNDYIKNFPKSYSVIYDNHVVSLFENGKFFCLDLNTLERNIDFENSLNTMKFQNHWIFEDKLVVNSGNRKFIWDGTKWANLKSKIPLDNGPKLYDDAQFIVYGDCYGEWGGTVYFYEKSTGKTFFTESTCTNTVTKLKKVIGF